MKQNQWNITKFNDRKITGTITAEEGQIMMTSIPWEDGWTVKVDGKKVEPVKILNALVGVPLEAGEHEVTMTFTPPGWNVGLVCLVAGILILILFYRYDKKHNAVLLAIAREKKRTAAQGGSSHSSEIVKPAAKKIAAEKPKPTEQQKNKNGSAAGQAATAKTEAESKSEEISAEDED